MTTMNDRRRLHPSDVESGHVMEINFPSHERNIFLEIQIVSETLLDDDDE